MYDHTLLYISTHQTSNSQQGTRGGITWLTPFDLCSDDEYLLHNAKGFDSKPCSLPMPVCMYDLVSWED